MIETMKVSKKIKRTISYVVIFSVSIYLGIILKDEEDNWLVKNINKIKIENFGFLDSKRIIDKIKLLMYINKFNFSEEDALAKDLGKEVLKPHHPVVIIPGMGSSVLELTDKNNYRQKIWGTMEMLRFLALNKNKWLKLLEAYENNGVGALEGIEGLDFIIPYYPVWSKFIRIITSTIGYNSNNLHLAPYDWRLAPHELEERDFYFTKLKSKIELLYKINDKKIIIITHSLGSIMGYYFINWINSQDKTWVDKHLDSFIPIAAPLLGAPKTISIFLSGEVYTPSTSIKRKLYDFLITKEETQKLARSFGSFYSLLPKGDKIYKNPLLTFENLKIENKNIKDVLKSLLPKKCIKKLNHHRYNKEIKENVEEYIKWSNPLLNSLPHAPQFKIYLLYGIGKKTECGYFYNTSLQINTSKNDIENNIINGIYHSDGDGTVPLISLGYMGIKGWKTKELNTSNIKVTIKEYMHKPSGKIKDIRGGPLTADHIDLLVNHTLITDLVYKICNKKEIEENIESEIKEMCN